jgi:hypothetical protein
MISAERRKMIRWLVLILMLMVVSAQVSAGEKVVKVTFDDSIAALMEQKNLLNVSFQRHAAIYYLRKSDNPNFEREFSILKKCKISHRSVSVTVDAMTNNILNVLAEEHTK